MNIKRETILAVDMANRVGLGIVVEYEDDNRSFDAIEALEGAAAEYCETEEGQYHVDDNGGHFNWGDLVDYLPRELAVKGGVRIVDTFTTSLVVEHDEQLNVDKP